GADAPRRASHQDRSLLHASIFPSICECIVSTLLAMNATTLSSDSMLPPPAPEAAAHSRRVAEHIARVIADEDDWIPFSRYMDLALYAQKLGYYSAGTRKFGMHGDFITAPE